MPVLPDPQRWREIERIFCEAADMDPEGRATFLDRMCGSDPDLRREVETLLRSDAELDRGFLQREVAGAVEALAVPRPPRRIGQYELLREIGRGGMGTVYLACRADEEYDTQVAIKLVRPGMDTGLVLMRFRRERQMLASFQHPNIARLLDGGTTDEGLPYIVMEYIDGQRISDYVEAEDLTIDSRVRLFLPVCEAVDYAHRRFVVHRDLKPGNILVDQNGTPKLLDFGIGKQLSVDREDTAAGLSPLTPDYASPEQVRGESVTIASDVYSLGAVLYELLSGARPHRIERGTPGAIEEAICRQPAVAPSHAAADPARRRRLAGDLDNIILRAMHKEPERRYGTAAELAEDLRRYLAHLPIRARPDSPVYRFRKFLHRHRAISLAAVLAVAGLAAAVVMAVQDARRERQRALETRRLAGSLLVEVHDALRDVPGATHARRLVVESALGYLERLSAQASGDPELRRELSRGWTRLGDAQGGVQHSSEGDMRAALSSYQRALDLLNGTAEAALQDRLARAGILRRMADVEAYTRTPKEALERYHEAQRAIEGLAGSTPAADRALAEVLAGASRLQRLTGAPEKAVESATRSSELLASLFAAQPGDVELRRLHASSLSLKGMAELRLGRRSAALACYREALAVVEAAGAPLALPLRREAMLAWLHVGDALAGAGSSESATAAVDAYEKVVALGRGMVEADPHDLRARNEFGNALSRLAAAVSGERRRSLYLEAREQLAAIAAEHPGNRSNQFHLALIEERLGDEFFRAAQLAAARQWWREAAASARRAAEAAAAEDRPGEAERYLARAAALEDKRRPAR